MRIRRGTGLSLCVAALALTSCRRGPAPPVEPKLAACLPPGALAVAGLRPAELRTAPVFSRLADALPAPEGASMLVVAYNGREALITATGRFPAPPEGATMAGPSVALFGSPEIVSAALAQSKLGVSGAQALLEHADAEAPAWAVLRGDLDLPVTGNLANINRLLRSTEYTSLSLRLQGGMELRATAICRTSAETDRLAATVRGMLLLLGPGVQPSIAQEGRSIRLVLPVSERQASEALDALTRRAN